MKNKIVLVPFPFDDLSTQKVRPALCLTDEIRPYKHIVLAFITSNITSTPSDTDLVISSNDAGFSGTGLKVSSTVRLHRLMTISKPTIVSVLGQLSDIHQDAIKLRLRKLFQV